MLFCTWVIGHDILDCVVFSVDGFKVYTLHTDKDICAILTDGDIKMWYTHR